MHRVLSALPALSKLERHRRHQIFLTCGLALVALADMFDWSAHSTLIGLGVNVLWLWES